MIRRHDAFFFLTAVHFNLYFDIGFEFRMTVHETVIEMSSSFIQCLSNCVCARLIGSEALPRTTNNS